MSIVARELLAIAFFVACGWAALWPMRARLGAPAYHLAALPCGLLAAPLAGCVSTLTGRPLDAVSAVAGGVVLIAALWAMAAVIGRGGQAAPSRVDARSFGIAVAVGGAFATVVGFVGFTIGNFDSLAAFWPLGLQLSREGAFTVMLISSRSPLIPAMNAIHATFGSDWAYVVHALMGATVATWLAMTLWQGPLSSAPRKRRLVIGGVAFAFLCLEPSFIFHSLFAHSHMVSGMYLLMSLTCVWLAMRPATATESGSVNPAFLVLGGLFASGLALARPDGLAYMFVPVAAAIAALTVARVRGRQVAAFFAPLLLVVFAVYGAGYAKLGMWAADKLSGWTALAILSVLALSAAGPWIVVALDRILPVRVRGERFFSVLAAVAGVATLGVFALKWESASGALETAGINLFGGAGGYGYLWYAVVLVLVVAALTRDALRTGSWTRSPFLAIALFLIIGGLVHGTSHEGRVGVGDSFNRVIFHTFPVIVWYAAAVVARILGRDTVAQTDRN